MPASASVSFVVTGNRAAGVLFVVVTAAVPLFVCFDEMKRKLLMRWPHLLVDARG